MTHNLVYVLFFVSAYCFTLPTTTEPIGCGSGGGRTGNCTPRTFRSPRHHTKPAAQAMRETRHARYATSRSRTQAERHVISGTAGPAPGAVNWPAAQGTDRRRGVLTAGAGLPTPGTSPLTQRHKWTASIQVMAGVLTAWDAAIGVGRGTDDCRGPSRS